MGLGRELIDAQVCLTDLTREQKAGLVVRLCMSSVVLLECADSFPVYRLIESL